MRNKGECEEEGGGLRKCVWEERHSSGDVRDREKEASRNV